MYNPLAATVGDILDWKAKEAEKNAEYYQWEFYGLALDKALAWSQTTPSSASKGAAQAYILAMPMAEDEGAMMYNSPAKGRATQILYILSNLQGWRGEEAREAKAILKARYEKDKV
jgi:hypothetical protein